MATEVQVANMALGLLDETKQITALSNDSMAARLVNLHFAQTRQAELSKNVWSFAVERSAAITAVNQGTGANTYTYRYALPAGVLRVLYLSYQDVALSPAIDWYQRAGFIYSDHTGPLKITYVADRSDPTTWDALFTDVMAAALAIRIALPLTHKADLIKVAQTAYERALQEAALGDAFQRPAEEPSAEVEIANRALGFLGEQPINALGENTKNGRLVTLHLAQTRQAELAKNNWSFAVERSVALTATNLGTGANTYTYRYTLPAGVLRVLYLSYLDVALSPAIDWYQRSTSIYSDHAGPLKVTYVADRTDPASWNPIFTDALSAALALKMAYAFTGKADLIQLAQAAYDRAIQEAKLSDAFQRPVEEPSAEVEVANRALAMLGEQPINAMGENTINGRIVTLHFAQTRRAEIVKRPWVFALDRSDVTGTDMATGDGTYNYRFLKPGDALRVLPVTYDAEPLGTPVNWRQSGLYLYSDQAGPLKVSYIKDVSDPSLWHPLFTEALAAALALKMAYAFTEKANMVQIAQVAYDRAIREAVRVNAIQRSGDQLRETWAMARGDDRVHWR